MVRDLRDAWGWIDRIVRRIERLESGAILESSSITSGRMRFIGGLLRVDSGGRVEIVGSLRIDGATIVNGTFKVEGPWSLNGNGEIAGNVNVTGKLTQNGPWEFIGAGKITGNVDITGTLSLLGGGSLKAGNIEINPGANGGSIKVGGHSIYVSGQILTILHSSGAQLVLNNGSASLNAGGKSVTLSAGGINFGGLPKVTKAGIPAGCVYKGTDGFFYEG